ncbi:MAG: HAD-IIA family hydrolase [Candidatus Acidiferrales bacterium]
MKSSRNGWKEPLGAVQGFMFDLDGTLILSDRSLGGYRMLPGAVETLTELQSRGRPFVVLTNGTAYRTSEQAPKLRALGLPIPDEALLTPNTVAADMMLKRGVKRVLVLGTRGVGDALAEAGIETVFTGQDRAEEVDAVYIAWHPECGMKDIEAACKAIWNGAQLYVASDVPFFATAGGKTMGYSHAITAAVRKITRAPMILTGKPSLNALKLVAKRLGIPMRRVGVVGDDPLVEMIMARRGKAVGFGVTTGISTEQHWAAQPLTRRPHRIVCELSEILRITDPVTKHAIKPRPS